MGEQSRKEALEALLAKVEAGEESWVNLPRTADLHTDLVWKAWAGSLDAAKALHEAVLPKEGWEVGRTSLYPGMMPGSSEYQFYAFVGWGEYKKGYADTAARAWLIAILKALIAREPTSI